MLIQLAVKVYINAVHDFKRMYRVEGALADKPKVNSVKQLVLQAISLFGNASDVAEMDLEN